MIFNNSGMGKCIVLKENETYYSLIYAIESKQFIVASYLDKTTGSWLNGHYYGDDLDSALSSFNSESKKIEEDLER
ncbi:MAG TPA: hypothetical protein DDY53_00365 [Clostridiales bacterium]|jgi:hypothetical protein|nr:hypothetical protein [Clostridiales bacterium]